MIIVDLIPWIDISLKSDFSDNSNSIWIKKNILIIPIVIELPEHVRVVRSPQFIGGGFGSNQQSASSANSQSTSQNSGTSNYDTTYSVR